MKLNHLFALMLALTFALAGSIACTNGGVKEQRNIATACGTINAAGNAIAGAVELKQIDKSVAVKALAIARPTKSWCEPKPVAHLSPADYAALLSAAVDLAALKKENVP